VLLFLTLNGVWIPRFCGAEHSKQLCGFGDLPFNYKYRRQLDAYFDVFGGAIGKDLLVAEEHLDVDLKKELEDYIHKGSSQPEVELAAKEPEGLWNSEFRDYKWPRDIPMC